MDPDADADSDPDDRPGETYAERHGFLSWLGVTVEEQEPGRVVLSLPAREELRNPGGALHGGVLATLIDHAGGATLRVGSSVAVVAVDVTSRAPDGERKAVATGRVTLHLDRSDAATGASEGAEST